MDRYFRYKFSFKKYTLKASYLPSTAICYLFFAVNKLCKMTSNAVMYDFHARIHSSVTDDN